MLVVYSYLTTSADQELEVEERSSSHLEGGQDDHILTEMFAAREELFGREMRDECEDCPGQERGDFLDIFLHLVGKFSLIEPIESSVMMPSFNYRIFAFLDVSDCIYKYMFRIIYLSIIAMA